MEKNKNIKNEIGQEILKDDLINIFQASEGSINMYYGLIGNGKTYNATADIHELLKQGKVVYCNWIIEVNDFDDRENFFILFWNLIFFRKIFYKIPCEKNLHYFSPENFNSKGELVDWLSKLNDCHIFFDEGQDIFDSYEGTQFSKAKRRLILHTRHFHRVLNIISQRPTAIQVSARGNVNRFYKCKKVLTFPWIRFARIEFQEMKGETVDETVKPISIKTYWGKKTIFNSYNTNYLSQGIPKSQEVFFTAFILNTKEKFLAIKKLFKNSFYKIKNKKNIKEKEKNTFDIRDNNEAF